MTWDFCTYFDDGGAGWFYWDLGHAGYLYGMLDQETEVLGTNITCAKEASKSERSRCNFCFTDRNTPIDPTLVPGEVA